MESQGSIAKLRRSVPTTHPYAVFGALTIPTRRHGSGCAIFLRGLLQASSVGRYGTTGGC